MMARKKRYHLHRARYTLIELLTAMAILIVMLYVVTRLVYRVQTLTKESRNQTEIYESAKVFFDIISQDLEGMVVSGESGREIVWTNESLNGITDSRIAFVTSSGIGSTSSDTDPTIEVAYCYSSSDSTVVRYMTRMSDVANWDFYGTLDADSASGWAASSSFTDSHVVAENVASFTMTVYGQGGTGTALTNETDTTTPGYVAISIELYDADDAVKGAASTATSMRRFTKNIFIYRGE